MKKFSILLTIAATLGMFAPTTLSAQEDIQRLPDDRVNAAVETEFAVQRGVPPAVDVEVNEGILTLQGSVDSLLERHRAEEIEMRVKGVRGIVNSIIVEPERRLRCCQRRGDTAR